jgi:hypothetical protein
MTIGQSFSSFFEAIEIPAEENARAQALQREVRKHLEAQVTGVRRSFSGGSFARGTAVRPLNDVDVFLELREELYPERRAKGPKELFKQLVAEVQQAYPTQRPQLRPQAHSLRLQLPGASVALDLIPAFPRDPGESGPRTQGYEIPEWDPASRQHAAADQESWILTFPEAQAEACKKANDRAGGMLNRLIKAVKHWNRVHEAVHSKKPLQSYHLELMCYRVFDRKPDSVPGALAALFRHLATHLTDPCPPPAGKRPDVGAYLALDETRRNWAQRRLNVTAKHADDAVALGGDRVRDEAAARAAWRSVLGAPFPA